jgi:hypothetical protein
MAKPRQRKLTTKAYIRQVGQHLEIEAPYNSNFVASLNHDIPKLAKTWVPDIKCTDPDHHGCAGRWQISINHKQDAIKLVQSFYPITIVVDGNGTNQLRWNTI